MNTARSSQTLDLDWATSLRLQEEAEQDQLRWFSAETPAYFAALLAFALGSSCWRDHAGALTVFAGTFATAAYWRAMWAASLESSILREQPRAWSARLRACTHLTGVLWAVLGFWAVIAHLPLASHVIYLLLTAALAATEARGLASDLTFSRRYLLVLLAPAVGAQMVAGYVGELPEGYALAAAASLFAIFMTARAAQLNAAYWETLTSRARLDAQLQEAEEARLAAESTVRAEGALQARISAESRKSLHHAARMIAMAQQTGTASQQHEYLEIVRDSTSHLLHLMNNLSDYAALTTGDLRLTPEPFEPRRLLQGVAAMFETQAAAKGLELRVSAGPGIQGPSATRALVGDPQRIGQVLANLVANAVKFTEQGRVEVVADCHAGSGKAELRFEVRDTGIGIHPDRLPLLLRSRGRNANASRHGTCMGLLVADALAERMGARIAAESAPGRGSCFSLTMSLPYAPGVAVEQFVAEQAAPISVLLVEDNPVNEKLARRLLEKSGCQVDTAWDGRQGVEKVKRGSYQVIFMDMQMPVMDGLEATAEIRRWERESDTPRHAIVAVTANAMSGDRERCLEAGMDDYISKPVQKSDLRAAVERWTLVRQ
jgi:signal transduction histidine kinase/ActR/RegA family two-component response regulator